MKQLFLIFCILILAVMYFWFRAKKIHELNKSNKSLTKETKDMAITLEISKKDLISSNDLDDLLFNLIKNYYPEFDDDNFENLDTVARTFVLIINIDGQVQNGGLIQFIDNSTGNYFHETIEAAKSIKNKKLVEILKKITSQYPNKQIPKDWGERRDLWDSLCEKHENDEEWDKFWDELDEEYYDNANTMNQELIEYLRVNAKLKE
jgi:hypothetical protein